jgi:hypothetical protein
MLVDWVTELVIPHLKVMGADTIWEPAAGEGGMADAHTIAQASVLSPPTSRTGSEKTWPPDIAQQADAIVCQSTLRRLRQKWRKNSSSEPWS